MASINWMLDYLSELVPEATPSARQGCHSLSTRIELFTALRSENEKSTCHGNHRPGRLVLS
jgi:hypothetical protein